MRILRQPLATFVLTFALATSIHAGVMSTPVAPPQPAPTPEATEGEMSTAANGTMHTGNSEEAGAGDAVVAAALSLVQNVLSLL